MSVEEGSFGNSKIYSAYLLNDYLAAILGTTGMAVALERRATEEAHWHVHLDLARVRMWAQDLGMFE